MLSPVLFQVVTLGPVVPATTIPPDCTCTIVNPVSQLDLSVQFSCSQPGDIVAGVIVKPVGAFGALETLIAEVPLTPALEAVTVKGPPMVVPEVKSPLESTVPPPLAFQVKVGCGVSALPNWSFAVAVNCTAEPGSIRDEVGKTLIDVRVGVVPVMEMLSNCAVARPLVLLQVTVNPM